ncbi:Hydrophobin [Fusarium sp. LHS14.1]|nr:Hydrophobin [Fusarium sp. LHS14.1]
MRFTITALALPIIFGAALAGPCRPSTVESSLTTSSETTALVDVTTTSAVTLSTGQSTDYTTTTTETISASTTTSMAESTTESTAAATSTTAPSGLCRAPASLQCCQTVGTPSSGPISLLLSLLGIVVRDSNILIGATCSPITNAGSCPATPLCCNDNSHGGLISIGCTRL